MQHSVTVILSIQIYNTYSSAVPSGTELHFIALDLRTANLEILDWNSTVEGGDKEKCPCSFGHYK